MISFFFIDEIHTIVGAGGATGSLDASICLNPL
jgi:ATP-dependent Clp protease ATP-binding subunit ClpA